MLAGIGHHGLHQLACHAARAVARPMIIRAQIAGRYYRLP